MCVCVCVYVCVCVCYAYKYTHTLKMAYLRFLYTLYSKSFRYIGQWTGK